jgi:hypothetical protein
LCCKFFLEKSEKGDATRIDVEVHFIDGEAGRDGVHQIIQFIINKNKGIGN